MSTAAYQVLDAALALSEDDRVELIDALLASLQPQDRPPFDDSWRTVIERRSSELQAEKVNAVAWEDVKRKARERTGD